jgi:hypothetical protein
MDHLTFDMDFSTSFARVSSTMFSSLISLHNLETSLIALAIVSVVDEKNVRVRIGFIRAHCDAVSRVKRGARFPASTSSTSRNSTS